MTWITNDYTLQLGTQAENARQQAEIAKAKADQAYWSKGGVYSQLSGSGPGSAGSTPWSLSGYGDQKTYDSDQMNNRLTEAQSAAGIRKDETAFNTDQSIRQYGSNADTDIRKNQAFTDTGDNSFNFRQGVMEQIAQRQKAANTNQASNMWANRNDS
jgi:hypothetical protein